VPALSSMPSTGKRQGLTYRDVRPLLLHATWSERDLMSDGNDGRVVRVPDSELDFDEDSFCTYNGVPFTGVGYEVVPDRGLSEVTYREGLQEGPARDWSRRERSKLSLTSRTTSITVQAVSLTKKAGRSSKSFTNTAYW
jgi:hypothetical protein